jgi:hypothetical protein
MHCKDWQEIVESKINSGQNVTIIFSNKSAEVLEYCWLDGDQQRFDWFELGPGEVAEKQSFIGVNWLVQKKNLWPVGLFNGQLEVVEGGTLIIETDQKIRTFVRKKVRPIVKKSYLGDIIRHTDPKLYEKFVDEAQQGGESSKFGEKFLDGLLKRKSDKSPRDSAKFEGGFGRNKERYEKNCENGSNSDN